MRQVICNKATECNSTECPHKITHDHTEEWCGTGFCRWSPSTQCISALEHLIMAVLTRFFSDEISIAAAAQNIAAIIHPDEVAA